MGFYSHHRCRHCHDYWCLGKPSPIHSYLHLVVKVSHFICLSACECVSAWYFLNLCTFFPLIEIHINAKSIALKWKKKRTESVHCEKKAAIGRKCESISQFRWDGCIQSSKLIKHLYDDLTQNIRFSHMHWCAVCDLCLHLFFCRQPTNSQHDHIFSFICNRYACMARIQVRYYRVTGR